MTLTRYNRITGTLTSASVSLSTKTLTEIDLGSKLKLRGERQVTNGLVMAWPLHANFYRNCS